MSGLKLLQAISCCAALAASSAALAQEAMKLTPQDYIDIQQLSSRYPFALEHCSNKGYDYADLYTDDGTFGVAEDWGAAPKKVIAGRDALANAANGGPGGCRDPKLARGYGESHIIIDLVITPTPAGAKGRSILLALGINGSPTTIERQGGYDDTYVKTAKGWRFKTRAHVFPNMANSVQFGPNSVKYQGVDFR